MRQDNRGMSLVELIIATTVSLIIMGAATLFINNALRSYEVASNTIDLQVETQVLMEQLGTWIMEGNRVEVQDTDVLIIYHIPRAVDASKIPSGVAVPDSLATKRVIWQEDGRLYMVIIDETTADTLPDGTNLFYDTDMSLIRGVENRLENCIGEYVEQFETAVIDVDGKAAVATINLKMREGKQEYELADQFKVRNELVFRTDPDFRGIRVGGNADEMV